MTLDTNISNYKITPLPVHPSPKGYETLSDWVLKVSQANQIDFLVIFDSILDLIKIHNIDGLNILSKLTLTSLETISSLNQDIEFITINDSSKNKYTCPFKNCRKLLYPFYKLRRHLNSLHDSFIPEYLTCNKCNRDFEDYRVYKSHYNTTHRKPENPLNSTNCNACNEEFENRIDYDKHYAKNHRKPVNKNISRACNMCKLVFENYDKYNAHYNKKHQKPIDRLKATKCNKCNLDFETRVEYEQHWSKKHRDRLKKTMCKVCNQEFENLNAYTTHWNNKHKDKSKPVTCGHCNKICDNNNAYFKHYNKKHRKPRKKSRKIINFDTIIVLCLAFLPKNYISS